jgi:hypothetical protein
MCLFHLPRTLVHHLALVFENGLLISWWKMGGDQRMFADAVGGKCILPSPSKVFLFSIRMEHHLDKTNHVVFPDGAFVRIRP